MNGADQFLNAVKSTESPVIELPPVEAMEAVVADFIREKTGKEVKVNCAAGLDIRSPFFSHQYIEQVELLSNAYIKITYDERLDQKKRRDTAEHGASGSQDESNGSSS